MSARTTYGRAGYDDQHEQRLVEVITAAIIEESRTADAPVIILRTGELTAALVTLLATALAMSPAATRSPTQIRKTLDELGRRLRRRIAAAEADPGVADFVSRCFRSGDVGGSA